METQKYKDPFVAAMAAAILKSRKIMLQEKALHNEEVVVSDGNGGCKYINARQFLATHPEFRL